MTMGRISAILSDIAKTALAQQILSNFDGLPDSEQIQVALEILRRLIHLEFPPLTDEDLVLNAEELFLTLDEEEASYE